MSDVFICYSRTDGTVASQLAKRLRAEGWSVFMDVQTQIGRRYDQVIEDELEQARAVVVLWSVASRKSHDVRDEAKVGRDKGILFPALIESVKSPLGFGHTQSANLIGWDGEKDHAGLTQLLNALKAHLNSREATAGAGDVLHADAVVTSTPLQPAPARVLAPGQTFDTKVTPAKWGLAAAVAGLMMAIGAGIYFSKSVRFVVDEEAMLQKEHEIGFILIQGAAEKASIACRELREIDLKRQNLEIAKGHGDTGLVDAYATQIEEIAKNIRDHASEYKDLIGRLVGIKKQVAEAEFERYANELLGRKSFDQVHVSRLVQRHYQNHLDGVSAEHVGLTRETCIEK